MKFEIPSVWNGTESGQHSGFKGAWNHLEKSFARSLAPRLSMLVHTLHVESLYADVTAQTWPLELTNAKRTLHEPT
jgi:hypothetical protein